MSQVPPGYTVYISSSVLKISANESIAGLTETSLSVMFLYCIVRSATLMILASIYKQPTSSGSVALQAY